MLYPGAVKHLGLISMYNRSIKTTERSKSSMFAFAPQPHGGSVAKGDQRPSCYRGALYLGRTRRGDRALSRMIMVYSKLDCRYILRNTAIHHLYRPGREAEPTTMATMSLPTLSELNKLSTKRTRAVFLSETGDDEFGGLERA